MKTIQAAVICALVCAMSAVVWAGQERPPVPGPAQDFTLPEVQEIALENGLDAKLVSFGAIPKVTVSLVVRAGNLNEAEDQVWLADLVGMYLKEGSATRSAEELADAAAAMGGQLAVNTGLDQTSVSLDVLSEFAPAAIELLAEVIRQPAFPEDEHQRLVADLVRQLSLQQADPGQQALATFRRVLYGDHPYGRMFPRDEDALKMLDVNDVRTFYEKNFGARRSHVYVVGSFPAERTAEALKKAFSDWAEGPESELRPPSPSPESGIYVSDRRGAPQSNLRIGVPVMDVSHPDAVTMDVLNTLLGGFFSSRITTNIREDKGYTYSPYSTVSNRYRDAYWMQLANVSTDVTGATLKEVFGEIRRLRTEAPGDEELAGIKAYMAGVFVLQNSSRGGIASMLSFSDLHGIGMDYLENYVSRVQAVTPEEVRQMAEAYLDLDRMVVAIAGDRAAIAEQLAPFGGIAN